ncbi:cell division regulator GpsB [Lactobacillus hamsteri]|uniref:Cell division initiation protein n=1 Tax=Lactobacillus hamsteri DSM 5661 = JCM 6256 TaxID=1423754 RepID=A0A0R1Y6Y1_9LACO|nr:cell division regulator GpsB [Lactobacillus hamsteri]KRM38074.1 hypothetical protein FC39_GL001467 [Lactobacillus hamsteri DSM 5661 = JCM 6256]
MADLNDIKLSSQDILKKQFRNKVKGYDPDEVDAYLDQVISDYETFHQIIEDLYGQLGKLQRELMEAKAKSKTVAAAPVNKEHEEVKTYTPRKRRMPVTSIEDNENDGQGEISTNMAIIQRISTLERKVYNLEQRVYGLQK